MPHVYAINSLRGSGLLECVNVVDSIKHGFFLFISDILDIFRDVCLKNWNKVYGIQQVSDECNWMFINIFDRIINGEENLIRLTNIKRRNETISKYDFLCLEPQPYARALAHLIFEIEFWAIVHHLLKWAIKASIYWRQHQECLISIPVSMYLCICVFTSTRCTRWFTCVFILFT